MLFLDYSSTSNSRDNDLSIFMNFKGALNTSCRAIMFFSFRPILFYKKIRFARNILYCVCLISGGDLSGRSFSDDLRVSFDDYRLFDYKYGSRVAFLDGKFVLVLTTFIFPLISQVYHKNI